MTEQTELFEAFKEKPPAAPIKAQTSETKEGDRLPLPLLGEPEIGLWNGQKFIFVNFHNYMTFLKENSDRPESEVKKDFLAKVKS